MVSHRSLAVPVAALALLAVACTSDDRPPPTDDQSGTVGGRVLLTLDGPLVGADVSVDQLEYTAATVVVREHIGDTLTDADGHFEMLTGTASGYFLITTRGGQFRDYATGQAVVLDPADELTALAEQATAPAQQAELAYELGELCERGAWLFYTHDPEVAMSRLQRVPQHHCH